MQKAPTRPVRRQGKAKAGGDDYINYWAESLSDYNARLAQYETDTAAWNKSQEELQVHQQAEALGIQTEGLPTAGIQQAIQAHTQGQAAQTYYQQAFPGTNPWEWLGSQNPAGESDIAGRRNKLQKELQKDQINSNEKIANINANVQRSGQNNALQIAQLQANVALHNAELQAGTQSGISANQIEAQRYLGELGTRGSVISAGAPYGREGSQNLLNALYGKPVREWDTPIKAQMAKLVPEIEGLNARTQSDLARAGAELIKAKVDGEEHKLRRARAKLADRFAKAELRKMKYPPTTAATGINAADEAQKKIRQLMEKTGIDFKKTLHSSNKGNIFGPTPNAKTKGMTKNKQFGNLKEMYEGISWPWN